MRIAAPLLASMLAAAICHAPLAAVDEGFSPFDMDDGVAELPGSYLMAIVIPDVRRLCASTESAINAVKPQALPAGSLATAIGAAIGDPKLALVGQGPVVMLVDSGGRALSATMMVPSTKPQDLVQAAQGRRIAAKVVGPLVAMSMIPDNLEIATEAAYGAVIGHGTGCAVRVVVSPKNIAMTYCMVLQSMIEGLATPKTTGGPDGESMKNLLNLRSAIPIGIMFDLSAVQCDVDITDRNIDCAVSLIANPGSDLGKALVKPKTDPAVVTRLRTRLDGGPALCRMAGAVPWQLLGAYVKQLVGGVPHAKDVVPAALLDAVEQVASVQDGLCMNIQLAPKGDLPVCSLATSVKDIAAAKAASQGFLSFCNSDEVANAVTVICATSRSLAFKADATTMPLRPPLPGPPRVDRMSVDQVTISPSEAGTQPRPTSGMSGPVKSWIAYLDDTMILATDLNELGRMAHGGRAAGKIAAEALFPDERDGVGDVDLAAWMAYEARTNAAKTAGTQGTAPAARPAAGITPAGQPPLRFAWATLTNEEVVYARIPLATIAAIPAWVDALASTLSALQAHGQAGGPGAAP